MMRFRGPTGHRERGASAVEAALVTPVVILLLLGIVEMGMVFKDYLGVSTMVRTGVRTASAHPRDAQFATLTAQAVQGAGAAVDNTTIEELWVYKLDRTKPGSSTPVGYTDFSNCGQCVKFRWNKVTGSFDQLANPLGGWSASAQNACPSSTSLGPPDRIGVYIKVKHAALTGLIFRSLNLADTSVMSLEPMPSSGGCS